MKCGAFAVTAALHSALAVEDQSVGAVAKIIAMLEDMSSKCKQEKKDEEVEFAKFKQFCVDGKPSLQKNIDKSAETIQTLSAEIDKLGAEVKTLGGEIGGLQADVINFDADKSESLAQREKDHAAFTSEEQDYSESVDALERAIQVLSEKDRDIPGAGASLLQIQDKLPMQAKSIISAFLGMNQDSEFEPPEAKAYEAQSGGIIEMLKRLLDEFRTKLSECQKEEMNSKHAYDMVQADLIDSIENSNKDIEEKTAEKESKKEKAAMDKKELASTVELKAADENTLKNLDTECQQKQASFEEKQQLRADEIAAIAKATEILSDGRVAAGGQHIEAVQTSLVQTGSKDTFLGQTEGIHRRLREFLASEASRLHSKTLGLLSEKVAADPFAKVKKLIDDMITRLLEEANADAEKEGWCDTEMGKSKVTRNKLSEEIDGLSAAIEDGKGTIMKLTQELADLADEIKELDVQMGESTALREEEKAKNKATILDAQGAQRAVAAATAVLKDFYAKAADATALLQTKVKPSLLSRGIKMGTDEWNALANPNFKGTIDKGHKAGQQTFGETYKGNQDAAGGVMALLEVALSDFANLEADTKAGEAESTESYNSFQVECKKSKAKKSKSIEMDQADRAGAESKLQEDIGELKSTEDELIAADKYHEKLVPQCIDQGMTWEELVKARQDEINSLKEALEILGRQDSIDTSA